MSHFLTFVLVGAAESDPARRARELLAPYFAAETRKPGGPPAKFDGYVVGGRYDGQLYGARPEYDLTPEEFQRRYGLDVLREADNIRPAREVPAGLMPYALVTPEGRWLDCENKGAARWRAEVREVLRLHGDCVVVAVDCHC